MVIVDAYNVLHAAGKVREGLGELTVTGLAGLIGWSRWAGSGGGREGGRGGVVLVCDGSGGRAGVSDELMRPDAPIRVVFAGPGKDADSAIERMVVEEERRRGGSGAGLVVVSSDKGVLASAVGPMGPKARRMTSEQFLRALVEDARRAEHPGGARGHEAGARTDGDPLDAESVARWVEEFRLTERARETGGKAPPPQPPEKPAGATEEWPEGIDPGDLDMGKWLGESKSGSGP